MCAIPDDRSNRAHDRTEKQDHNGVEIPVVETRTIMDSKFTGNCEYGSVIDKHGGTLRSLDFQASLLAWLRSTDPPSRFPGGILGFRPPYSSGGCAGFAPDFLR